MRELNLQVLILAETVKPALGDDYVVDHADAHQLPRLHEPPRQGDILFARCRVA